LNAPRPKRMRPGEEPSRRHGPSALVLAAGTSSRFLGTKQLAEIGGKTLIERVLDAIPSSEVRETVVVLGHEARMVAAALRGMKGVKIVINEDYARGMGGSIRTGISALAKDSDGVMLLLADQPFVTRPFLLRMLKVFERGLPEGGIVAATRGGVVAPPVIFPRKYFRELADLEGDQGARSIIERHADSLLKVRVASRAPLVDLDTREDIEEARRLFQP
jgi:molybdenum cofactor cytidylyltransferase